MSYQIYKGIPLPKRRGGGGHKGSKYQFDKMEIGDSHLFQVGDEDPNKVARRLTGAVAAFRKTDNFNGQKFAVRHTQDENGNPVVGVWRVAES